MTFGYFSRERWSATQLCMPAKTTSRRCARPWRRTKVRSQIPRASTRPMSASMPCFTKLRRTRFSPQCTRRSPHGWPRIGSACRDRLSAIGSITSAIVRSSKLSSSVSRTRPSARWRTIYLQPGSTCAGHSPTPCSTPWGNRRMSEEFDHIVIGGGAAGCVAAARLVGAGRRVLLLEAGHSHRHPLLDMPPGIFKMINGSKFMQYHQTTPQEHLGGRVHDIPQGHVLGGGSSVNAQVYMRGRPSDYREWDELLRGNNVGARWDWEHVLPHFRSMEGNNRLYDERHN